MNNAPPGETAADNAMRQINLFKSLDEEALAEVSALVRWKKYRKGTEVIPYLDDGDDVYFIASGRVRVTLFSFSGKQISYQELGVGEMFGELSAIDRLPRAANVIALEAAQIGHVSGNEFRRLVDRYPAIAAASLARLAGLVRFLIDRVYQYGALDVKDRIRMEILRLARDNMSGGDSATIQDFPTHKEIANRVNTHREAVTRELNELSRMGLVEQEHRVLVVTTVSALIELLPDYI